MDAIESVLKQFEEFESRVRRDPIKSLKLRYEDGEIAGETLTFESRGVKLTISAEFPTGDSADKVAWEPAEHRGATHVIAPLGLWPGQFTTLIAFKIDNEDPDYRIKPDWVRRIDPPKSQVFLLDTRNSIYYYPVATDLTGEILAGHPKTGLFAFEPLRKPTDSIQVHFSDVKLTARRGERHQFSFRCEGSALIHLIEHVKGLPSLREQGEKALEEARKNMGCPLQAAILLLSLGAILAGVGIVVVSL
jgi:hypothetical protein